MRDGDAPWRVVSSGLRVRVRVTPKASRDSVEGLETTADGVALKIRVRAVPEDGAANEAVARVLAAWLEVPPRSVTLAAGGKSRVKTLEISGDGASLAAAANDRLAGKQAMAASRKG